MSELLKSEIDTLLNTTLRNTTEYKIAERITEIVNYVGLVVNALSPSWNYGDDTAFVSSYYKDPVHGDTIIIEMYDFDQTLKYIDKDGKTSDLMYGIPARWLYEDYQQEFVTGYNLYKQKDAIAKAKAKEQKIASKAKRDQLRTSAMEKLTDEEKQALGIRVIRRKK